MRNRVVFFLPLFFLALFWTSCKKSEKPEIDLGFDYYPNIIGTSRIYAVDSIVYNSFTLTIDTFKFELRDELLEEITDQGNRLVTIVRRSRRALDGNWKEVKSWQFYKTNFLVEEQFENLPVIKMTFPVKEGQKWDANIRNTLPSENFTVIAPQSVDVLNKTYSDVITVDQRNESDPLQLNVKRAYEQYARHVGLIYKYDKTLKRFTTGEVNDVPIDSGLVMIFRLKN